jgi:hypothetical protein
LLTMRWSRQSLESSRRASSNSTSWASKVKSSRIEAKRIRGKVTSGGLVVPDDAVLDHRIFEERHQPWRSLHDSRELREPQDELVCRRSRLQAGGVDGHLASALANASVVPVAVSCVYISSQLVPTESKLFRRLRMFFKNNSSTVLVELPKANSRKSEFINPVFRARYERSSHRATKVKAGRVVKRQDGAM